jgi:hypothetical protein
MEITKTSGNTAPTTAATPVVSKSTGSVQPSGSQGSPAGGQQPSGTQGGTGKWEWQKDPRFGKIFHTVDDFPNLYHSLEEIHEKKYKPTFQKYSELEKKFSEGKLDINKIDEYLKNYNEALSPDNPKNQIWNYLNELIDDDVTAQDFQGMVTKLRAEKENRKYPGMSQEQRQQAIENNKKLADLETKLGSIEREKNVQFNLKVISDHESQIKDLCKKKGFEFTDNIKTEFWNYMRSEIAQAPDTKSKQYLLSQMRNIFIAKYGDDLDNAYEAKLKSGMIERQQAEKSTTISFAKKPGDSKVKQSLEEKLRTAFNLKKEQTPAT